MFLSKVVIRDVTGEFDVYLHKVVLVHGREDRPAQSGQEYQMCIDYQPWNKVIVTDNYPVPDLEDCVRYVQKATFYMSLDLKSGYNNLIVDPALQKFTGFVTQDGMYIFERLSFGFKNASVHFQRCVQTIIDKDNV